MFETTASKQRSKTVQINPHFVRLPNSPTAERDMLHSQVKKNPQKFSGMLSQSNKLDKYVSSFSTRASGKINSISPTNQAKNFKTQV